jgi:hypothetical protein
MIGGELASGAQCRLEVSRPACQHRSSFDTNSGAHEGHVFQRSPLARECKKGVSMTARGSRTSPGDRRLGRMSPSAGAQLEY